MFLFYLQTDTQIVHYDAMSGCVVGVIFSMVAPCTAEVIHGLSIDKVWGQLLVYKLRGYAGHVLGSVFLRWMISYLKERMMRVGWLNSFSAASRFPNGVPQSARLAGKHVYMYSNRLCNRNAIAEGCYYVI